MTAAHAGYGSERVPVGGAAAVCERLCAAWAGRDDVDLTLLGPGPDPPDGVRYLRIPVLERSPSDLSELRYARFCREFERAATARILDEAGGSAAAVLSHDISESPDFAALRAAGTPAVCLVHVDVVEYFARIYLGGRISAPRAAHLYAALARRLPMPDVLRLVFDKQARAVAHCRHLVVPSAGMRSVLHATYPGLPEDRVRVIPWGTDPPLTEDVASEVAALEARWGVAPGDPVLLTLSRISPEKGQDTLLEAIAEGERAGSVPPNLRVVICGAPAYMRGGSFHRRLQRLAARLRTPVVFAGHLGGVAKRAALTRADVFVSVSRHESYGLTTMEALSAGRPVVALRSHGSEATVDPTCGILVDAGAGLWDALRTVLRDDALRQRLSAGARARAAGASFAVAAEAILELLRTATASSASRSPAAPSPSGSG